MSVKMQSKPRGKKLVLLSLDVPADPTTLKGVVVVTGAADGTVTAALVPLVAGDLLVGNANGTVTKLTKGTDGQVLKMVSGAVAWAADAT